MSPLALFSNELEALVTKAAPGVVAIEHRRGNGTGLGLTPDGFVLTNEHVVRQAGSAVRVRFFDGASSPAEVVGRDAATDLAVLKTRRQDLAVLPLAEPGAVKVGQVVIALGHPFGFERSVTFGVVSALERRLPGRDGATLDNLIQTDAAINPGNSGGPLFNLRGEVVGINTAINAAANSIGFSVPSTLAKALVPQLEARGFVVRGWLGLAPQDISPALARALNVPGGEGALVVSVTEGGPASRAGVKDEDVIVALDGIKVPSASALVRMVGLKRPDAPATLSLWREGKPLELKVTLGTRPDVEGIGAVERPQEGDEKRPAAPRLGLAFDDLDPRFASATGLKGGAAVVEVTPGSPAEKGGLRRGMVVTEANHKPVKNRDELLKELKAVRPGDVVLLRTVVPGGGRGLQAIEVP